MPKKSPLQPLPESVPSAQHTFRVPREIENRIRRAMKAAGYTEFTSFAITSMISKARQIEAEHKLQSD